MKKSFAKMGALALAALLGVTGAIPAQAQGFGDRDRVIGIYCDRYNDRECWNTERWDDDDYHVFYRRRHNELDSIAAGVFGLTFGAILGSALSQPQPRVRDRVIYLDDEPTYGYDDSYEAHVAACYSRYRSYDEETDTFLGFDGYRHRCRL
jgi:hypothetical protein